MRRCTSLYQFLTTNWCCVFTAQLLPGRKLASKSTFQGLLFIFSSITNTFYSCLFAASQQFSNLIINIVHCHIDRKRLIISLNAEFKFLCTLLSRVKSVYPTRLLFLKFFQFYATHFHSLLAVFTRKSAYAQKSAPLELAPPPPPLKTKN